MYISANRRPSDSRPHYLKPVSPKTFSAKVKSRLDEPSAVFSDRNFRRGNRERVLLLLFSNLHILQKLTQSGISIDAVGVDDDPAPSIIGLYSVDNGHVVRIARSFKPVMFNDGQFCGCIAPFTSHGSQHTAGKLRLSVNPRSFNP